MTSTLSSVAKKQDAYARALPTEILSDIYKHLCGFQPVAPTLKACRLVSRNWESVATPLLFSSITLTIADRGSAENLQKLANTSLVSLVHTVHLQAPIYDHLREIGGGADMDVDFLSMVQMSSAALHKLVKVHTWKQLFYNGLPPNTSHLDLDTPAIWAFDAVAFASRMNLPRLARFQANVMRIQHFTIARNGHEDETVGPRGYTAIGLCFKTIEVLTLSQFGRMLLGLNYDAEILKLLKYKELIIDSASCDTASFVMLLQSCASTLQALSLSNLIIYRQKDHQLSYEIAQADVFSYIARNFPKLKILKLSNVVIRPSETYHHLDVDDSEVRKELDKIEEGTSRVEMGDEEALADLAHKIRVIKQGKWVIIE